MTDGLSSSAASISVTPLSVDQIPRFKALRLRALRDHPDAFLELPEAFEARSIESLALMLAASHERGGFILVAQTPEGNLVGSASLAVGGTPKDAHRGLVWGVYVAPEARGLGVGRLLLRELIGRARGNSALRNLTLAVVSSNEPALRLYRSLGFREYGLDRDAMCVNGEFLSEVLMSLNLAEN
jgi:ribosomal protein S18 acetylase RimI-like enzyme